jgi:hypothetical protein
MATRCCWPPERREGILVALFGEADPAQQLLCLGHGLAPWTALDRDRRLDDVLQGGHVGKEVELLEDHARLLADLADVTALLAGRLAGLDLTPSISMTPAEGSSRKFRQRRNVLLPPPEGPMMTTTSAGATSRSTPWMTCRGQNTCAVLAP